MSLVRPTTAIVWELRGMWAAGLPVRASLTERCMVRTVIGRVQRVAVTGAWVLIDGWHIPAEDILSVARPTLSEINEYKRAGLNAHRPPATIVDPRPRN